MLERIKTNLGISAADTALDDEINALVAEGEAELVRLGVPEDAVSEDDVLIQGAVIAYACAARTVGTTEGEQWERVWSYKSDCLRKTVWGSEV